MEQVQAVIHSLNGELDVAQIIQHKDLNHCIAVYKGHLYVSVKSSGVSPPKQKGQPSLADH